MFTAVPDRCTLLWIPDWCTHPMSTVTLADVLIYELQSGVHNIYCDPWQTCPFKTQTEVRYVYCDLNRCTQSAITWGPSSCLSGPSSGSAQPPAWPGSCRPGNSQLSSRSKNMKRSYCRRKANMSSSERVARWVWKKSCWTQGKKIKWSIYWSKNHISPSLSDNEIFFSTFAMQIFTPHALLLF